MDLHQIFTVLLTTTLVRDVLSQDNSGWQPHYLESYRFIPILGDCYQLYNNDDTISTCRRKPNLENQACIRWTSEDRTCMGLITPTNETVVFRCTTHIRFDTCFEVYDTDQNLNTVCQEIFEGHSVGITTPDNFTILFHSDLCRTATNLMEREVYSNFVNNFSEVVESRSCYKVYNEEQVVSPYSCLSPKINEACVFNLEGGCMALTTQNNEVLILDCPDENQRPKEKNCFYLYNSDNEVHTVCQEKLEERCIGIVTPSNLTVLFECFFCSEITSIVYYNKERKRVYRQFVKNYLSDEYLRKNLHLIDAGYIVFGVNQFTDITYPRWMPKTSCYGFTLESNETIFLKCMVQNENQEQPGCFSIVSEKKEKHSVCTEVLNEGCVGLKTPKNVSIALACYGFGDYRVMSDEGSTFFLNMFGNFVTGTYNFRNSYDVYKENQTTNLHLTYHSVHRLDDKPDCLGIKIESEIVVLTCDEEAKINGCFSVIKRDLINNDKNLNSTTQINEACVKIVNDNCVGIITPDNWTISFECIPRYSPGGYPSSQFPSGRNDVSGFISDSIPSHLPLRS